MWWCGNWWYMGWWGPLLGLLWFVLLGLFVYWLVRSLVPEKRDRALEILKERYAKGEIDKETFERMKRELG
ncbi:SHOCT domain-containing protein [Thermus albus]|uniref:SHOCT domain-containing protein n=1 Tax=Thermus albus TaxID=2908146 RepID=UPI001FAA1EF4|nr:SHOCT domain-containing protein [Thermus albus]